MKAIILDDVAVNGKRIDISFRVDKKLQRYFQQGNHLFFQYNDDLKDVPVSVAAIPFVANTAPLAWITNSSIYVSELDKSFYDCLANIKKAYQRMYPDVIFSGEIHVDHLIENSYTPEHEAAQLFSGGLDALATFIRIKEKKPLLITEYGWHQHSVQRSKVWDADEKHVTRFACEHNLDNILIHSNYGTFISAQEIDRHFLKKLGDSWWHGLHHSLAIISAAIPIAYKEKINCIYIASSYFRGYRAKCASDPTIDNEIKFASGHVFHDGYEINRQEKVKLVVDYYANKETDVNLRVCFLNEKNCCHCEKCVRTIVGIVAEGSDPSDFGFPITGSLSQHISDFLKDNVKYFTPARIMQWNLSKDRMKENQEKIMDQELVAWFVMYDFAAKRKKALLKYRLTKFVPIIIRRVRTRLNRIRMQNL
ncbi:peptidase [Virgibacillus sp. Bac332]|uniref:peptidase n=1 Tax=Virgibacillus sp. Bac332 TaxID=2419842 RepID=UPI000EF4503E|nr:peptidase [Virgibacillus sp. Bac332]